MRRLKILFIAGWYPRKDNPVAGIFVREHAKAVSLYNDVTVLYVRRIHCFTRKHCEITDTVEEGIRTIRITYTKSRIPKTATLLYVWHVFQGFRTLVKEGWRPDIIHAHVYTSGVPAVIISRLFRVPLVMTEHSSAFPRKLLPKRTLKEARFAMRRAKIILPVSEALKAGIESYGIKNTFRVVPNVVDTNLFHPDDQIKKDANIKRILLVASLSPVKGVPYLLESLSILKAKRTDFVLDIIGDGPNRKEYEELSVRLGISDNVRFRGIKTKQHIAEFMRKSHFFVLSSLWENLPCVLIEALASGLPIIATQVGGIPEILNKEAGILVPPKDPNALAKSLDYMLEHTQDYSPEQISRFARERFSYEAVGKTLEIIYKEIAYEKANR